MLAREALGRVRVACAQGREDLAVHSDRLREGPSELRLERERPPQEPEESQEHGTARGLIDVEVEAAVELEGLAGAIAAASELGMDRFELLELRLGHPGRSQPRSQRLERRPHLVVLLRRAERSIDHRGTAVEVVADQALGFEPTQRLANGRGAHPEALGEIALAQRRPAFELTRDHGFPDGRGNDVALASVLLHG